MYFHLLNKNLKDPKIVKGTQKQTKAEGSFYFWLSSLGLLNTTGFGLNSPRLLILSS